MAQNILLQVALILVGAKFAGILCERILGQSAVLGELLFGVAVGANALRLLDSADPTIGKLALIGSVLLLFNIGLECDLQDLLHAGREAVVVALIGIGATVGIGYFAMVQLGQTPLVAFFVASAISATSIGITARVFGDFRFLDRREAHVVLSTAVVDDLLGLAILTALSSVVIAKTVDIRVIAREALVADGFLVAAVLLGIGIAPRLLRLGKVLQDQAALSIAAVIFCFTFAGFAELVHLAPILGAFAAGLVLNRVESKVHFEANIKGLAEFFMPIFFVVMGAQIDLRSLNPFEEAGRSTLILGLILCAVAVIGKLIAGLLTPAKGIGRWIVGAGLIPRGEVALVFAALGQQTGLLSSGLYAAILFVVMVTTFVTPILLRPLIQRQAAGESVNG